MGNPQSGGKSYSGSGFGNLDSLSTLGDSEKYNNKEWYMKEQQDKVLSDILSDKEFSFSKNSYSTDSDEFRIIQTPYLPNRVRFKDSPNSFFSSFSNKNSSTFTSEDFKNTNRPSMRVNYSPNSEQSTPFSPARLEDIYFPKSSNSPIPAEEKSVSPLIKSGAFNRENNLKKDDNSNLSVGLLDSLNSHISVDANAKKNLNNLLNSYDQYKLNIDPNPLVIKKKSEPIHHVQNVAFKFLKPPQTNIKQGDIIVRKLSDIQQPPISPLMLRVTPPRPESPSPIILREQPPPSPKPLPTKIIKLPGRILPPPPRKVIIEHKPKLPAKPRDILIERWLDYQQPIRKVRYEQEPNIVPLPLPKNEIIQWESPELIVEKKYSFLGVEKADPANYKKLYQNQLLTPNQLPKEAEKFKPPPGERIAANSIKHLPLLKGDVQALGLIDLEKENLSEYREIIRKEFGHENLIREVYTNLYNNRYKDLYKGYYSDFNQNQLFSNETKSEEKAFENLKKSFDLNNTIRVQLKKINGTKSLKQQNSSSQNTRTNKSGTMHLKGQNPKIIQLSKS